MRLYRQDTKPLWDDAYTWQGSWLSFQHIQQLLIQTSRSITSESKNGLGSLEHWEEELLLEDDMLKLVHQHQQEDSMVRGWLVFPPTSLREFWIWTKAFKGHMNGERMAIWMPSYDERRDCNQWQIVPDHSSKGEGVCDGDFI